MKTDQPTAATSAEAADDGAIMALMELLFFAYRDFTSDPDAILSEIGFGRAHHRVIHFVGRHPGLRVSELLSILRITKQSLGRVLRELIEKGLIYQKEGESDRRQRLLFLTGEGRALHERLAAPQKARLRAAISAAGGKAAARPFAAVLLQMTDAAEREAVRRLTGWQEPGEEDG